MLIVVLIYMYMQICALNHFVYSHQLIQSFMSSLTTVNYSDTFNPKIVSMIFGH